MKELMTYTRTVQYLVKLFKLINLEYFSGELEMPTITVQSTTGAYGHITTSRIWHTDRGEATYELNIGADYLSRPIENVVATLIHEACHLYALMHGIKDTSNRGVYHNRKFRDLAVARGLDIQRHEKYGWSITSPTDETLRFCLGHNLPEIRCTRGGGYSYTGVGAGKAGSGAVPKKSSSRKYVCPVCGAIVRATRIVNIMCMDCSAKMVENS